MKFDYDYDFKDKFGFSRTLGPGQYEKEPLPNTLPKWVRDEFDSEPRLWGFPGLLTVLRKVPENKGLLNGLQKLKKLQEKNEKLSPPYLLPFARLLDRSVNQFVSTNSEHKITPKRRREITDGKGKSIGAIAHARKLRDVLVGLNESAKEVGPLSSWHEATDNLLENLKMPKLGPYRSSTTIHFLEKEATNNWVDGWIHGAHDLLKAILNNPNIFLDGVVKALEEWREAPTFARTKHGKAANNDKNDARNFFVVKMNIWFNARCLTDMHEFNAALVQCLIPNCDEISSQGIFDLIKNRQVKPKPQK